MALSAMQACDRCCFCFCDVYRNRNCSHWIIQQDSFMSELRSVVTCKPCVALRYTDCSSVTLLLTAHQRFFYDDALYKSTLSIYLSIYSEQYCKASIQCTSYGTLQYFILVKTGTIFPPLYIFILAGAHGMIATKMRDAVSRTDLRPCAKFHICSAVNFGGNASQTDRQAAEFIAFHYHRINMLCCHLLFSVREQETIVRLQFYV